MTLGCRNLILSCCFSLVCSLHWSSLSVFFSLYLCFLSFLLFEQQLRLLTTSSFPHYISLPFLFLKYNPPFSYPQDVLFPFLCILLPIYYQYPYVWNLHPLPRPGENINIVKKNLTNGGEVGQTLGLHTYTIVYKKIKTTTTNKQQQTNPYSPSFPNGSRYLIHPLRWAWNTLVLTYPYPRPLTYLNLPANRVIHSYPDSHTPRSLTNTWKPSTSNNVYWRIEHKHHDGRY